jgi:ubiquinone/menaquinone biosynthesis C-methylase UbiE
VGRIAEHISDLTGARVLGVDFASETIKRAQIRTRPKDQQLSYQVMDMDEVGFPGKCFTGMIAIDSLHFARDIRKTVQSMKGCLDENGQMGVFYAAMIPAGETSESLKPEWTPLGKVLQEFGLNYETWDFTQDERDLWERILRVAEELKSAYSLEGNLHLYEAAVADARPMFAAVNAGKRRRYLYHIR